MRDRRVPPPRKREGLSRSSSVLRPAPPWPGSASSGSAPPGSASAWSSAGSPAGGGPPTCTGARRPRGSVGQAFAATCATRASSSQPFGPGAQQCEVDVGADRVDQPRVSQRLGAQGERLDVRGGERPGVERQVEPREVDRARLGAPRPHPPLAAGVLVEPLGPERVERGGQLLQALDQTRERQRRRLGQHPAHHVRGVLRRERGRPGDAEAHPVGVDQPRVPGGPELGDRLDRGLGLAQELRHPRARLDERDPQLVGAELAVALAAAARQVGIGERRLAGGAGVPGLVVRELPAPRERERHGVVRRHGPRIDLLQQGAQLRAGWGRGDPLRQRCEHLFEHDPRLARTPDNHGPFRETARRQAMYPGAAEWMTLARPVGCSQSSWRPSAVRSSRS